METTVLILTVGEKITFDTLDSLKYLPEHHLTIWYNGDRRRFYKKLRKYTDDVIMSSVNKGMTYPIGSTMLYFKYDFLVVLNADNVLNESFYDKVKPFLEDKKVGMIGQSQHKLGKPFVYCNNNGDDYFPDNFYIYKKEFINEMGAYTPSHELYGHIGIELYKRTLTHSDWKIVCFDNDSLGIHGGEERVSSSGTDLLWEDAGTDAMRTTLYKLDHMMWQACEAKNFKGYNWWSTNL